MIFREFVVSRAGVWHLVGNISLLFRIRDECRYTCKAENAAFSGQIRNLFQSRANLAQPGVSTSVRDPKIVFPTLSGEPIDQKGRVCRGQEAMREKVDWDRQRGEDRSERCRAERFKSRRIYKGFWG